MQHVKFVVVKIEDLRVLCRTCHDKVHEYQERFPNKFHAIKNLSSDEIWSYVLDWLGVEAIHSENNVEIFGLLEKTPSRYKHEITWKFGKKIYKPVSCERRRTDKKQSSLEYRKSARRAYKETRLYKQISRDKIVRI